MLLQDYQAESNTNFTVQLFGTDINETAIDYARRGRYPESIQTSVSPERLRQHFSLVDGSYQIAKDLRERCLFSRHDLLDGFSQQRFAYAREGPGGYRPGPPLVVGTVGGQNVVRGQGSTTDDRRRRALDRGRHQVAALDQWLAGSTRKRSPRYAIGLFG